MKSCTAIIIFFAVVLDLFSQNISVNTNENILFKNLDTIKINQLNQKLIDILYKSNIPSDSIEIQKTLYDFISKAYSTNKLSTMSYGQFKEAFLKFDIRKENENTIKNMNLILQQNRNGCLVVNDEYRNYRNFIASQARNNITITLFSSNPAEGLIPALREIMILLNGD